MRNPSRENFKRFRRESGIPRTLTGLKRTAINESEVRVGRFKYDPEEELGKGYSSKVYKGMEIGRSHRRVAIKMIDLKTFKGKNLAILQNEIEIHKSLEHDHIVKLIQVIKTSHYYYLIMQYCPHGNLDEYIAQKKNLSEGHAIEIITQLIEGYKYLLSQGVLHRDIKPANILRIGNKWKISDFGFAARSRLGFMDRMNVGTPLYMAPEIMKRNYYSYKSDFYAIGVVLFQMLTGETPHQSGSEKELLEKITQEIVLPKNIRNPKIIEFLSKLFLVSDAKRMQRQEFESFQFGDDLSLTNIENGNQGIVDSQTGSVCDNPSLKDISVTDNSTIKEGKSSCRSESKHLYFSDEPYSARLPKNPIQTNQQVLQTQLQFVHHFYWLIRNSDTLELQQQSRSILMLTLFKLLLKIMHSLCDKNKNYFELSHWQEYQQCKLYQQLYSQIIVYSEKYEQQYLEFVKHNDIKIIRSVMKKFPELSSNRPLTSKFYANFMQFLGPLVHQQEAQVALLIHETEQEINHNIQGLQSLYAVYKVAQLRSTIPNQSLVGERFSKLQDYSQTRLNRSDYQHLKRQIKNP